MITNNKAMLYDAVSEFIQLHAFDHLLDNELAQLKNALKTLAHTNDANQLQETITKLKPLLSRNRSFSSH